VLRGKGGFENNSFKTNKNIYINSVFVNVFIIMAIGISPFHDLSAGLQIRRMPSEQYFVLSFCPDGSYIIKISAT